MGLSIVPKPKPSQPLIAVVADRVQAPRQLLVHSVTEEAEQWFEHECKAFGNIGYGGEGVYILIVKLNYDVVEVANYINGWRPSPPKELDPAWAAHIDQLDWQ